MTCMKCGGTGVMLDMEPCDCGATPYIETEEDVLDRYIPKLYQTIESLEVETLERTIRDLSVDDVIDNIIEKLDKHPSVYINLTNTELGAYQVYYYLMRRLLEKYKEFPKRIDEFILVNGLDEESLENLDKKVSKGEYKPLILISDYEIDFSAYNRKIKMFQFKGYKPKAYYPLNIYSMVFLQK